MRSGMKKSQPDITKAMTPEQIAELEEWFGDELTRFRRDPLTYGYPPHEGQERIHGSERKFRLVIAANRSGKSVSGMREVLWHATMTHPYQPNIPMTMIWVGFPDYPFYRRVTRQLFLDWVPKDKLVEFHESDKVAVIRRADGGLCEIHFLSYDMDRMKWQGASVDLCWLDEECPEDIFREAIARLIDKDGRMLMTLTPVSGMGWIYDRLYLPGKAGSADIEVIEMALAEHDPSKPGGVGRPLVPHLSYDRILRFALSIPDEDERAVRIFGEFRARSGVVYKAFRPEVHVIPAFKVPAHWDLWCGLDPGYHGFATVLCAISDTGRVYVIDEYFSQEEPLRVRAPAIWEMVRRHREDAHLIGEYIPLFVDTEDPQLVRELSLWAEDNNVPLAFKALEQGKKARKAGITRLQEMLDPTENRATPAVVKRPRPSLGEPLLYIFDNIHSKWRIDEESYEGSRLTWELARYLWKAPTKGAPHPIDADDNTAGGAHMLAALRYAVMARMGAVENPKEDIYENMAARDRRVWERFQKLQQRYDELENGWVIDD